MKIVFFNHFHNGDIHVSRGLIRQIMTKLPNESFVYSHKNHSDLLSDIPGLCFEQAPVYAIHDEHIGFFKVNDTVFINTWYAQQRFKYMNRYGISMDTLYAAFDDTCKSLWGFSLNDISTDPSVFFPCIDYSKFQIKQAASWLNIQPSKKIFVSNGAVLSDQAHHFSLTPIIESIAKKHIDKIFILSNKESHIINLPNVFYSADIIGKITNDLNENSFISSHCDVIIGKASGSFTFAMTQENMFQRNVKFIGLCNLVPTPSNKFWINELLRDKIHYKAQMLINNESDPNKVFAIIDSNL